jgi:hypothetical protein
MSKRSRKDPMPGILDDTHPGCYYREYYVIAPIIGSKRYAVIGPNKEGTCVYLKTCNTVESAKKWIDKRPL